MNMKNTLENYGSIAKLFHWIIALLVITLLTVGFIMGNLSEELAIRGSIYTVHKLLGLLVWGLMLFRLAWSLINPKPLLPKKAPRWEKWAVYFVHGSLYVVLLAMPLSGWIMSTAADHAPHLGSLSLPLPGIPISKTLAQNAGAAHEFLAWVLIALVIIHIVAALKHYWIDRDKVLQRMLWQ